LSATGPNSRSAQLHSGAWPRSRRQLGPRAQRARPMFTALAWPVCTALGLRLPGQPRPERPMMARRDSSGGSSNGGGRAPTTVRLPTGHGGGGDSSLEHLIDGEGEKTGSAVALFQRGGATVAGGGPATGRREGEVSSTLHRRKRQEGGDSASPTIGVLTTAEAAGQR
jgi:hypothetical protein